MEFILKKIIENKIYTILGVVISIYFIYIFGRKIGEFLFLFLNKN
jgi:hypothetical protein